MASIIELKSATATAIRNKTDQKSISKANVADRIDAAADELLSRGIIDISSIEELSSQSGVNTKKVICKNVGLFRWETDGIVDNIIIFPAAGGGVWKKEISTFNPASDLSAGFAIKPDLLESGVVEVDEEAFTPQEISLIRDGNTLKLQIDGLDGDPVYSAEKPAILGGNTFGEKLNLGTIDNFGVGVIVNGVNRMDFNTNGRVDLPIIAAQTVPGFSNELLSSSGWTSTGWTGSFAAGWAHTPGTTTALTNTLAAGIGKRYDVSFVATGWTTGTITITFGGQSSQPLAAVASGSFGPTATTTGTLSVSPSSTFDGTLVISVKEIFDVSIPSLSFIDNTATISASMRFGLAALQNLSIGPGAGGYITSGFRNVNIGSQAGSKITSGTRNANFGSNAGASITTGQNNICAGDSAGETITSGIGNALFGQGSGSKITNGGSNTGAGYLTLANLTSGLRNTASGVQALFSATSPNDNTACGYYALGGVTTTGNNSGYGALSGRFQADGATILATPVNSVYIGANTKGFTNGVTNENVFGYNAIGAGSNTVTIGDNNITATFLKGSIGIGKTWTTSAPSNHPSAILDIESTTKGILPPRMTTSQMLAITTPSPGLEIHNITEAAKMVYDGTRWTGFRFNGTKFQGYESGSGVWVDLN